MKGQIDPCEPRSETAGALGRWTTLMLRKPSQLALAAGCGTLLLALAGVSAADEKIPSVTLPQVVYLDTPALERMRTANPDRYARVERILAATNHLCRPKMPDVLQ